MLCGEPGNLLHNGIPTGSLSLPVCLSAFGHNIPTFNWAEEPGRAVPHSGNNELRGTVQTFKADRDFGPYI